MEAKFMMSRGFDVPKEVSLWLSVKNVLAIQE